MALEPPGLAPDLGDLLPGDEILKTDSDLGSLAEPAAEDIVRPDQLFLLIHHRDADREVLHRIHRTGRNARGQVIQIAQELLLLPVVGAFHVDDDPGHDDKEEQPQRPILRSKQQCGQEQQADHELRGPRIYPYIAQHSCLLCSLRNREAACLTGSTRRFFSTILTLYRTRNRRRMQEGRGEALPHRPFGPWSFEIHRRQPRG